VTALVRFSLVIVAAVVALGLWLAEVYWVKGWAGLAWLDGFNWSSLPICAVIVTTCSDFVAPDAAWRDRIKFVFFALLLTIAAFVSGRWAMIEIDSIWGWYGQPPLVVLYPQPFVVLGAAGLTVSGGLTVAANRWLTPLYSWTVLAVIVSLALVLPLSFVTVAVFPALNGDTDWIHAIKMGYPVLWTALLVPPALRLGRKRAGDLTD
jgi:hypothetical protein